MPEPTVPLGESAAFPIVAASWATDKGILDSNGAFSGLKIANNFAEITNKPLARYNLGLDIGTNVQPYSSKLSAYASGNTPTEFSLTLMANTTGAQWRTSIGAGTVTSVGLSGGTTGLTIDTGPITTSGTFTIGGMLSAANGGTGVGSLAELKNSLTLNNVDNTHDIDKPVSTATQIALNTKYDKTGGTISGRLNVSAGNGTGGISGPPTLNWASKIIVNQDNNDQAGLSVHTRWAGNEAPIFECAKGWNGSAAGYYPVFTVTGLGNVGIGLTNPSTQLHVQVAGNAEIKSTTTSTANSTYGRVTVATGVANAYCIFQVTNGTGTPYRLTANGTGVPDAYDDANTHTWRKTDGTQKASLDVNGNFTVNGTILTVNSNKLLLQHDGTNAYVRATNGTSLFVGANGTNTWKFDTGGALFPVNDNVWSLGAASNRASVIYAGTGSINTSDRNAKDNIQDISETLLDAWAEVKWQTFQFKDAVLEKGADGARWHFGLIAQDVRDAIDRHLGEGAALRLALVCYDEWAAITEVVDGVTIVKRPPGNRWGLRYDECFVLEAAYQRRRMDRIEAALAALQSSGT